MAKKFLQHATIESAFVPVDMSTAANAGDWVGLGNYERVVAVLFAAAGTGGDDPAFKLQQATDASGTGAKDLEFTTIHEKVGTLTDVTAWTRKRQAAAPSYVNAASAESQKLIAVEVQADELDVDGGFTHIQLSVAEVGDNGQIGCGFYILLEPRYPQASVESALA